MIQIHKCGCPDGWKCTGSYISITLFHRVLKYSLGRGLKNFRCRFEFYRIDINTKKRIWK